MYNSTCLAGLASNEGRQDKAACCPTELIIEMMATKGNIQNAHEVRMFYMYRGKGTSGTYQLTVASSLWTLPYAVIISRAN